MLPSDLDEQRAAALRERVNNAQVGNDTWAQEMQPKYASSECRDHVQATQWMNSMATKCYKVMHIMPAKDHWGNDCIVVFMELQV